MQLRNAFKELYMLKLTLSVLLLVSSLYSFGQNNTFIPANDHKRKLPLTDALNAGAGGVSIEIKLDKNGNWSTALDWENLYLKALKQHFSNYSAPSGGEIRPFLLLLRIKGDSAKTLDALNKTLAPYASCLTQFNETNTIYKPVSIGVYGDIPYKESSNNSEPRFYFSIQPLLNSVPTNTNIKGAYIDFDEHYKWNGKEFMPNMQYHALQTAIKAAKKQGLIIMAEDCPETDNAYTILKNSGVDYFIVGDFEKYQKHLQNK
jgi:hypothetical protein